MADFTSFWNLAKEAYKPLSTVASIISSTGFIGYAIRELKKKYAKPELICSLVLLKNDFTPLGDTYQNQYGEIEYFISENSLLRKFCKFTISNNSENIAYKIKVLSKKGVDNPVKWYPEPDYSIPVMPHSSLIQEIIIESEVEYVDRDLDTVPPSFNIFSEIVFEFRNAWGTKFKLIFSPNEKDVEKRSRCIRI